jgi:hypothetical protein
VVSVGAFFSRYIEPGESLGEVTFGLIMCLTFTLGSGIAAQYDGDSTIRLIYAAIGCNITWGIIDAAMYVMGQVFERGRIVRLHRLIQGAADKADAVGRLYEALAARYGDYSRPADLRQLAEGIYETAKAKPLPRARVTRDDLIGATLIFLLVAATVLPVAVPFLILGNSITTLRISNCLMIASLYLAGHLWSHHTNAPPLLAGGALATIGVILVGIAIALGG